MPLKKHWMISPENRHLPRTMSSPWCSLHICSFVTCFPERAVNQVGCSSTSMASVPASPLWHFLLQVGGSPKFAKSAHALCVSLMRVTSQPVTSICHGHLSKLSRPHTLHVLIVALRCYQCGESPVTRWPLQHNVPEGAINSTAFIAGKAQMHEILLRSAMLSRVRQEGPRQILCVPITAHVKALPAQPERLHSDHARVVGKTCSLH